LVLKHLSSSDSNDDLCQRAACDLHRVSKQHQSEARATLRHLHMDRFYEGLLSAGIDGNDDLVPWELLAACPKVTSWTLAPQQLVEFYHHELGAEEAAAASKIKRLKVHNLDGESDEQQAGLGKLLWACNQLAEVQIACDWSESKKGLGPPKKPWLLLDPNSSSWDTATAPRLPLRSWVSHGVPHSLLAHWVAQQQLAPTLRSLALYDRDDGSDISWVTSLTGLQELTVDHWSTTSPPTCLSAMRSLTEFIVESEDVIDDDLLPPTGLKSLGLTQLPGNINQMSHLTALDVSNTFDLPSLPSDLGVWLPNLEQLGSICSNLPAVPATLSRLTGLYFSFNFAEALSLPSTLKALRELHLSNSYSTAIATLGSFTALEVLDVSDSSVLGDSLAILKPLTRLRHLNMSGVGELDPASFTVLGTLQQLTHLNLRPTCEYPREDGNSTKEGITAAACSVLADTQPLPALEQLDISYFGAGHLAALAPWVGRLTALTSIKMEGCAVDEEETLLFLPAQLQEVRLSSCGLWQLPAGLQRLSALEVLQLRGNPKLRQLPGWLSQLRCLSAMDVSGTGVQCEQEVLAHMPALRCVRLVSCLDKGVLQVPSKRVFSKAPHLHFGHSRRC
jgi:Leucine-rich repeat (LRR) protein